MKRLCTASNATISLTKNWFQTTQLYSKIGLTYALNADSKEEASLEWKHLSMGTEIRPTTDPQQNFDKYAPVQQQSKTPYSGNENVCILIKFGICNDLELQ